MRSIFQFLDKQEAFPSLNNKTTCDIFNRSNSIYPDSVCTKNSIQGINQWFFKTDFHGSVIGA